MIITTNNDSKNFQICLNHSFNEISNIDKPNTRIALVGAMKPTNP